MLFREVFCGFYYVQDHISAILFSCHSDRSFYSINLHKKCGKAKKIIIHPNPGTTNPKKKQPQAFIPQRSLFSQYHSNYCCCRPERNEFFHAHRG
jgi:hypothetical protein